MHYDRRSNKNKQLHNKCINNIRVYKYKNEKQNIFLIFRLEEIIYWPLIVGEKKCYLFGNGNGDIYWVK